ncbi:MAG: hypothetical protein IPM29_03065 [Planctomycetes bacterium]|nr:hypothetical protein [Planctomycetota bacterium]
MTDYGRWVVIEPRRIVALDGVGGGHVLAGGLLDEVVKRRDVRRCA